MWRICEQRTVAEPWNHTRLLKFMESRSSKVPMHISTNSWRSYIEQKLGRGLEET